MSGAPTLIDGRYELGELLGQGGMGRVHVATDRRLGRRVAVKLLRPGRVPERAARRLEREAILAARVQHANVVAIHDAGHHEGSPYVVMELVGGESAAAVLARDGAMTVEQAVGIGTQVLDGLGALHGEGLVHRDVTPANVLLSDDAVKLADLGIAREVGDDGLDLTRPGDLLGTAAYLAPERATGAPATERSDLYAVGAVLYELLAGRPPHQRSDAGATALAHLLDDPVPLSEAAPDVPYAVAAAIERLLAREPQERPASAEEAARSLRDAAGDAPARRPTRQLPVAAPWPDEATARLPTQQIGEDPPRVRRRSLVLVGAAVLAVAALVLVVLTDDQRATDVAAGDEAGAGERPTTSAAVAPTTSLAATTTVVPSTTAIPSTTAVSSTTTAPSTVAPPPTTLPADVDALVGLVADDPEIWGERSRVLLRKLEERDDFDARDYDRMIRDVERWLARDRLDPDLAAALLEAFAVERRAADDR